MTNETVTINKEILIGVQDAHRALLAFREIQEILIDDSDYGSLLKLIIDKLQPAVDAI